MGTGDWNDGMNRVGEAGRGESVWLGWFLHATLSCFRTIGRKPRRDSSRHVLARIMRAALAESLEREGWDGQLVSARILR